MAVSQILEVNLITKAVLALVAVFLVIYVVVDRSSPCFPASFLDEYQSDNSVIISAYNDWKVMQEKRKSTKRVREVCPWEQVETNRTCWSLHVHFLSANIIPTYGCPRQTRVGAFVEGGKWVCNAPGFIPTNGSAVIYSVGSKGEVSFDKEAAAAFSTVVHTFDPTLSPETLESLKKEESFRIHEIGFTGELDLSRAQRSMEKWASGNGRDVSAEARMAHMEGVMAELNHSFVDVLKMDCERCEEGFLQHLKAVSTREKPLFGQFLVEMHRMGEMKVTGDMFEALEGLGFHLFHAEPNFYAQLTNWELAFIHEKLFTPN